MSQERGEVWNSTVRGMPREPRFQRSILDEPKGVLYAKEKIPSCNYGVVCDERFPCANSSFELPLICFIVFNCGETDLESIAPPSINLLAIPDHPRRRSCGDSWSRQLCRIHYFRISIDDSSTDYFFDICHMKTNQISTSQIGKASLVELGVGRLAC